MNNGSFGVVLSTSACKYRRLCVAHTGSLVWTGKEECKSECLSCGFIVTVYGYKKTKLLV